MYVEHESRCLFFQQAEHGPELVETLWLCSTRRRYEFRPRRVWSYIARWGKSDREGAGLPYFKTVTMHPQRIDRGFPDRIFRGLGLGGRGGYGMIPVIQSVCRVFAVGVRLGWSLSYRRQHLLDENIV